MLLKLQRQFLIEAANNMPPLDDRRVERFFSNLAGRPVLIKGKSQMLFSGMDGCPKTLYSTLKINPMQSQPTWCLLKPARTASSLHKGVSLAAGPYMPETANSGTAIICSACSGSLSNPIRHFLQAGIRHVWSLPTMATAWQGRQRHALCGRRKGRRRTGRGHRSDDILF